MKIFKVVVVKEKFPRGRPTPHLYLWRCHCSHITFGSTWLEIFVVMSCLANSWTWLVRLDWIPYCMIVLRCHILWSASPVFVLTAGCMVIHKFIPFVVLYIELISSIVGCKSFFTSNVGWTGLNMATWSSLRMELLCHNSFMDYPTKIRRIRSCSGNLWTVLFNCA